MSDDFSSPDRHAQSWHLVSREALADRTWMDASDMNPALLVLLDCAGDWWAISPHCRQCASPLAQGLTRHTRKAIDELDCARCSTPHGPAVADCECVSLMVVDEEIYALTTIDALHTSSSQDS